MLILSVETSCDETGIALVEASGGIANPKFMVLRNLVSSQINIHRPFGGVVPNLAKREHTKNLPLLWKRIMNNESRIMGKKSIIHNSRFIIPEIDLIAVTVGPGLEPALWAGITFAKELARKYKKPLIGTNHLEGHLYSFLLKQKVLNVVNVRNVKNQQLEQAKRSNKRSDRTLNIFPAIALLVSGGHTTLLKMDSLTKWKKLGETRDDAAGEAFDKVARMLKLPYPGGPEIEKIARKGNPSAIAFPRPMKNTNKSTDRYDFSFSGLKTSVLYYLRDHPFDKLRASKNISKSDVAASFQEAIVDVLVQKTVRAAGEYSAHSIILCGGVAANKALRERLRQQAQDMKMQFFVPESDYNGDNAAMIAAAGYFAHLKKKKLPLAANGDLGI